MDIIDDPLSILNALYVHRIILAFLKAWIIARKFSRFIVPPLEPASVS